jgi:Flp pilus assembly protein TadG
MKNKHLLRPRNAGASGASPVRNFLFRNDGSQMVEFALALPFLLVFVVGIMDFGQAFNLKQKLNNASREAARFAANENSGGNNLSVNGVSDVSAIRDVVANYLTNAGVTQCTIAASPTVSGFVYTFNSSSAGCTGTNFSLVVNRAFPIKVGTITSIGTYVTITYPYTWSFVPIIRLLVPSSTLSLPTTISTDSIMQNIN